MARKNLAITTVASGGAPSPATSGTAITVTSDATLFVGRAFASPPNVQPTNANTETLNLTALPGSNVLTVTRNYDSRGAQSIADGWLIYQGVAADEIETLMSAKVPSGGSSGQVLAKNSGTDYDMSWATAGGGTPQIILSDTFNKGLDTQSGTMNLASTSAKGFTYDGIGIFSAFSANFYATARKRVAGINAKNFFSGNSTFAFGARDLSGNFLTNASGIYAHAIMGDYDIGSITTPSYSTKKFYGFKFSKVASTFVSSYTNGDGTTAVATAFTLSIDAPILFAKKVGSTMSFYDNGTLLGASSSNAPTSMTNYLWTLSVSNTDGSATGGFGSEFMIITKDAY